MSYALDMNRHTSSHVYTCILTQAYDCDVHGAPTARVFDAAAGQLLPYDLSAEAPAAREERRWADERLRQLRLADRE